MNAVKKKPGTLVVGKHLLLPVVTTRIKEFIPHAKFMPFKERLLAVIPHKLEEAKILRNLGITTPSPILHQYEWNGRYMPFSHQRTTADFITMNSRCFVFNGLGSGKSKAALWAADYLMSIHRVRRVLIVCPVSVVGVWEDEVFSTMPSANVATIMGSKESRLKKLARNAEICIINFDGIKTMLTQLQACGFDMVIVDECSDAYRNHNTDRHKAMRALLKPDTRLVMMTATPTPTGPTDAYGLAKLVNPTDTMSFTRWRDMVMAKIGPFKWKPKPNSEQAVHALLQPAIKFATEDCIDLPPISHMYRQVDMGPEQKKAYATMKRALVADIDGGEVKAVNAAVLLTKLLQISCLAAGSEVLTIEGWKPIESIAATDLLWDGEEWANSCGIVCNGWRPVVNCHGVWMTPDHKVLTVNGWAAAEDLIDGYADGRFNRAEVRAPDGFEADWCERSREHSVADAVSVRQASDAHRIKSKERQASASEILRVQPQGHTAGGARPASTNQNSVVQSVVGGAKSLQEQEGQRLGALWRTRDYLLRAVGHVHKVFRRHGPNIPPRLAVGPRRQRPGVLAGELQVGDGPRAGEQQAYECVGPHRGWANDTGGFCAQHRNEQASPALPRGHRKEALVYDVVNAGPRSRFTVRGTNKEAFIVHNCGVVKDSDGAPRFLDNGPRLDTLLEVIREAGNKAIVYVPFRASQQQVHEHLLKHGLSAEVINGDVNQTTRAAVFREFQNGELQVIVAHPKTASHGLNLNAASNVIWFGPVFSLELYVQANARVARPGQQCHMNIHHIYATEVEKEVFNALKRKGRMLDTVMELFSNLETYD